MDNPLRTALKIFDAAARGAFDIAAAFWRPFLRQPERQEPPAIEHTKALDRGRNLSTYKTATKVKAITAKTDR
jgi:hypothetical protein